MPRILDVEQALLLLELEPPFDQRAVQLARRRMAKRWHPDIAPPGRQHEHQRHLQAINEAADQLEQLAESSRGGRVTRNAVKVSAAAARKAREEAGRRAYEAEQRERAAAEERAKHDPFGSRVPDHSVVHRYARCLSYPEWGVGTVTGIYFSGDGDDVQQWARVRFSVGVRTVPAGSLQFVDFSKPDPAADRVQRFMTAAQHALAEGDAALAAQRLVYARDAEPTNPVVLRLLTARLLAGRQPAGGRPRGARLGARRDRPPDSRAVRGPRIYEDMGAIDLAAEAAERAADRAPGRRLGLGAPGPPAAAADGPRRRDRGARAGPADRADGRGSARRSRSPTTWPATSAPRSRPPRPPRVWSPNRRAPGRATPTRSRAPTASASASRPASGRCALGDDEEVADLLARVEAAQPRSLSERTAA